MKKTLIALVIILAFAVSANAYHVFIYAPDTGKIKTKFVGPSPQQVEYWRSRGFEAINGPEEWRGNEYVVVGNVLVRRDAKEIEADKKAEKAKELKTQLYQLKMKRQAIKNVADDSSTPEDFKADLDAIDAKYAEIKAQLEAIK